MIASLVKNGVTQKFAEIITEPYIEAKLSGKLTHGLNRFLQYFNVNVKTHRINPKIIKDKFNYAFIDGKKELGHLTALFAIKKLITKVKIVSLIRF